MSERDKLPTAQAAEVRERLETAWQDIDQPLLDYLRGRLGSSDAREAAQETYLKILRHENPAEILNLTDYVFTVAKNLATDWLIRRDRHDQLNERFANQELLEIGIAGPVAAEQLSIDRDDRDVIRQALDALPERVRIVAHDVLNGNAPKDIAHRRGMSLRTVYRYIERAYEILTRRTRL